MMIQKLFRRFALAIAILTLLATSVAAQRQERVVDSWKPLHYDVTLSFNEALTEISSGRAIINLQVRAPNLRVIDLDFGEMPIDSVLLSGKAVQFERSAEKLNVSLPDAAKRGDQLELVITYHGHPKDGLIFAKDRDGKQSATGDNWPNRVHHWIPTLDHPSAKATASFTISAPQRYQVIANGKL
ncbi:MAG TPA: hypothetical protein VKD91_01070, partial [Pyrinomonadaceae bacterium]|nr:hypothetical protein [Pyrinomonadaceae bacterium]